MPEEKKEKLSHRDRQIARIDQLKKQLQKEEAKLRANARKERNAQLVALGLFLETYLKNASEKQFQSFKDVLASIHLSSRTLQIVLAAMDRILDEKQKATIKNEVFPEPTPSTARSINPQA